MCRRERLLIGAMGALSPVIATLITNDFIEVLQTAGPYETMGYVLRVIVLALVGMFVVYLYEDESNKMKVFQLGMAAPALFMATINGNHGSRKTEPVASQETTVWQEETSDGDHVVWKNSMMIENPEQMTVTEEIMDLHGSFIEDTKVQEKEPEEKPIKKFMHGLIRSGD